ncbi:MAG: carboxypeptidase regulatory-like domain-containing protein [Acidobacteria bacterium]|nr:carboxypeptidase regulatory-like domain-containing protein [Acidobacteriota bacterium]
MQRHFLCSALCLFSAGGQEFRATLTGRVVDPSGAAVAGVPVVVRHVSTNETSTSATDVQGSYTVPFLRPGAIAISVEAPGFKRFTQDGVTLRVGQAATLDITLEVGAVTDQVTVTGEVALLETAKADRGTVIDKRSVQEFPLNARNPFMLSMLVAGVQYNGAAIYQRPFDNGAIANWSINGSLNSNNEFLLDGAPNNAQAGTNNIALVPSVDAVEEFKIQTNSYDAQYGKTGGGIINVSLKSGTNDVHGTLYEFARRNGWDANSFQNNAQGAPKAGHFLDQYGGQIGGPIFFPKLYNGRNRSFFMVAYEGYREGTPNPLTLSVPEPEMRQGDFSRVVDARGAAITIYDPATGRASGNDWLRNPFPGNRIPANRINPIAARIAGYFPAPNTRNPVTRYSRNNFFVPGGDNIAKDDFYNLAIKIDHNFGNKHRMFFRHASNDRTEFRSANGIFGVGEDGPLPLKRINDAYVIDMVSNLAPTAILNWRVSFNRYVAGASRFGNQGFDKTTLGFPQQLISQVPHGAWFGRYEVGGYIGLGNHFGFDYTNTWSFHPTLTKIYRSHTIKTGMDMRWIQWATTNAGQPFRLAADDTFTRQQFNRADALSGDGFATWLLGNLTGGQVDNNVFPIFMYRYFAPYFQDDWKVSRRLTLNLGLRWDLNMAADERYNRLNRGFEASQVNPVNRLIDRQRFPNLPQLRGGLSFAGDGGVSRRATNLDKNNVQLRLGFAYQISQRLVMRGGWGRYYMNPTNSQLQLTGFSQSTPIVTSNDGNRMPVENLINNPFPGGVIQPSGNSLGLETFAGRGYSFVNPDFQIPYVNQFSYGFQTEFPWKASLEASYVGNRSRKLETSRPFNEWDLNFRKQCNPMEGGSPAFCDALVANPFVGLEPFRGTGSFTNAQVSRASLARPYPHFGGLTEVYRNDGSVWYNSMQLTYNQRSVNSLNIAVAYTLSKMIGETAWNDVQDPKLRRGVYLADKPHAFTVAGIYSLPVGKGKKFGSGAGRATQYLIGGWETNVIMRWYSGQPWDLNESLIHLKDPRLKNIDWDAPVVRAVSPCVLRWNDNGTITPQGYSLAAGCGTDQSAYSFLIAPRYAPQFSPDRDNRIRLHSAPQFDISFNKTTQLTERYKVQFRAESFNTFNTYWFYAGNFNNNPEDANFGTIVKSNVGFGSTSFPRHIQFAVKFIF